MDRRAAKELVHIQGWLARVEEIAERGKGVYLADGLLQEAGDSLMMKLGEAANRLARLGGCGVGDGCGEPELPHPPVRRDRPRADLAHPVA